MPAPPANSIGLVLDCVQRVASSHLFIRGWLCWPRERPAPRIAVVRDGAPVPTALFTTHARPDIIGMPLDSPEPLGFFIILRLPDPQGWDGLEVALQGAGGPACVPLAPAALGPSVPDLLAHAPWHVAFDLMHAAAGDAALQCLLQADRQRLGVFGRWIDGLPVLPAAADDQHGLRRMDAIAAPSGECAVAVTVSHRLAEGTELRVVAVQGDDIAPGLHRLDGPAGLRGDTFLALYGRQPAEVTLPAPLPELVVELREPRGGCWFRTRPRGLPAPAFLDTLRSLAGGAAAGDTMHSFAWLRGVLEDREAGFAHPARLIPHAIHPDAPVVTVLHAIDDPFAARLVLLAAAQIERHAAEVLVVGPRQAAEAVADIFLQRGRIPARTSLDLAATVRRATYARCALVPIDGAALGDALVAGTLDSLFARQIPGAALPTLLRLAAIAGTMDGADTLARLAQLREGATALRFGRAEGAFGHLLSEHLAGFWRDAAPGFAAEVAHEPA